jgi:hypothetical protein
MRVLTRFSRWAPLAAAALVALFAAAACEDEPSALGQLSGGCLINSDCEPNLACVFQRCHIQCNKSDDCPLAADGERLRCVLGDKPEHVCQLEDERNCAYNSECQKGQVCGPDGQCRDECLDDRDCVTGQVCTSSGVCADPSELDEHGNLTVSTPPPEQSTGFPCAYDSQCVDKGPVGQPPLVCRDGSCNYACYDNVDCEPGFTCEPDDSDAGTPGSCEPIPGTVSDCIPGAQVMCDCYPSGQGVQICLDDGSGYGPCMGSMGDCGPP